MTRWRGATDIMTPGGLSDSAQSLAQRSLEAARRAADGWAARSVRQRLRVIARLRRRLGDEPLDLARTADLPWRSSAAETLTAEVLPLLDACRFLERQAASLLAPRRPGRRGRPAWLFGSALEVRREPHGVVLVIAPSNYPILLAGVQLLQALVAGNAVLVKPGRGGLPAMQALADDLAASGLPPEVLQVLPESVEVAEAVLAEGVDKVVLTGSRQTGLRVLEQLAPTATPAVMELSGCDAAVVMNGADLAQAARAIAFAMTLNGGFTCIAPRRLLVAEEVSTELAAELARQLDLRPPPRLPAATRQALDQAVAEAVSQGAVLVAGRRPSTQGCHPVVLANVAEELADRLAEIPAPAAALLPIRDPEEALARVAAGALRLGVSVFGPPKAARALARRMDTGVAVVNDLIVPTADPRAPFGGRGASGFGTTRGPEGLLEMTVIKTLIERRGRWRPHYDPVDDRDAPLFQSFVQLLHGSGLRQRLAALRRLAVAGRQRQRRER
ncbi:MAG: aldehyde dehydrogenase family protein [Acidobacteriota bacterium]